MSLESLHLKIQDCEGIKECGLGICVKSKYDDILTLMREELPASAEEAKEICRDYPDTKLDMMKKVLTAKNQK